MSGVRQGSHLEHLLQLRARVDDEIAKERVREAAAEQRRAAMAAAQEQARRVAQKEAERVARREAARADRDRAAAEHLAQVEEIEANAPADLVRTWARAAGITVGDRGRLSLDLRKQYLAATRQAST